MATLLEHRVLQPLDPPPDDVNEWPDFTLTEVKIFYQGKGKYADLLEASEEEPLCVLGELVSLDDEQQERALLDDCDGVRLKIDNVTNYSFGQDDNGKPVVWAAGGAGWYEITPADRYMNHYNDTIEAIDLFYFMVDQHQKLPRQRQRLGFKIDPFLTAYQRHTDYRIDDDDEAMETIHKHHRFLMKQMIEERENIDWSKSYLWNHLSETYPEVVESLKAALAQLQNGAQSSEEESSGEEADEKEEDEKEETSDEQNEEEEDDDEQEESQEDEGTPASPEPPKEVIDWTPTIWELLNILRKSPNFNMRHCGIDKLAEEFQKSKTFPDSHPEAISAIERAAQPLLKLMNEARLRKKFNWSTRAIYSELEAALADSIAENDTKIIIKTPAHKPDKRHRQKSVLRPSGAGKAKKRTRTLEDSEGEVGEPPTLALRPPKRNARATTADTAFSMEDSPSRQLNGHVNDPDALPELPPAPEAQEMLELVAKEAKMVGRQHQTSHLEAFLGQWVM